MGLCQQMQTRRLPQATNPEVGHVTARRRALGCCKIDGMKRARCAGAQEVKDGMQTALTGCGVQRYMENVVIEVI